MLHMLNNLSVRVATEGGRLPVGRLRRAYMGGPFMCPAAAGTFARLELSIASTVVNRWAVTQQ
jgi:hypothetical protein